VRRQLDLRLMKSIKRAFNGIQCHSHRPSYQGIKTAAARMSGRGEFSLTGLSEQARDFGSALQDNVGLWAEKKSVSASKPRGKPNFWSGKQNCFRGSEQFEIWSPLLQFITERRAKQTLLQLYRLRMPLRGHASPSRGRNHGQRGNPGGRGVHNPQRVSPLAYASPSSPGSDDSDADISNSVQTVKFRYFRRTNKPIVSTLITVIFTEEEGEEGKGKGIYEEQEPSSNNSSQSGSQEESSYLPSSQSKLEEESTGFHSKEQNEALREICSLMDMEITSSVAKKMPDDDKKPARFFGSRLYPILPPGILRLEDIPAGMEIEYVPDPEREEAEWEAEQQAAKQKENEDQAAAEKGKE